PAARAGAAAAGGAAQLITCGGGGAYLAATHTLPESIAVPPEKSLMREARPRKHYQLRARYPSAEQSRRYSWGVFYRLPWRNSGFGTLLAVLHTLLLAAYVSADESASVPWFTVPALGMSAVVLASCLGFSTVDRKGPLRPRQLILGAVHGLAHLGLGLGGAWLWHWTHVDTLPTLFQLLIAVVIYAPLAGVAGSLLVCGYLLVAHRFGVNVNELFAGQGIEDSKCFLRLRIGQDGSLTVYPVALDQVCRHWRAAPHDAVNAPWIAPEQPLRPRLSEPPVTVASAIVQETPVAQS
ncbi:MAG: metallophosphoesterase, partial [Micromonosporaceae bacterium]